MTSPETFKPDIIDAYKSSIMSRYELALATPSANCHSAAYYLLGVEPQEDNLGGAYVDFDILEPVYNVNDALLIAFGEVYKNDSRATHLAVLHPFDHTKVIHRDVVGYYETRRSHHNFFTELADIIDQFTIGLNPIMIEPLSIVQQRRHYSPMYLFTFKPEYFEEILSSFKST
jgi:hypothetical protein